MWEVFGTEEFETWYRSLTDAQQDDVNAAVNELERLGPGLGRPWVDTLKGARLTNMKELRPRGGHLRVLFAFDPRRAAILLLGGDKTDRWDEWYAETLPKADRLYAIYLEELRKEGEIK